MKETLRIVLYGESLVLAGVRSLLEAIPAFQVISLSTPEAGGQDLLALQPDVVIFDTRSLQPQFSYDQADPGLQLVGLDPDRDQALVWSGQRLVDISVQELIEVIRQASSKSIDHLDAHDPERRKT